MVYVIGNGVVLVLSLVLFWMTRMHDGLAANLPLTREQLVVLLTGVSAVLFGFSLWRATVDVRKRREARNFMKNLETERQARADLDDTVRQQAARIAALVQVEVDKERLVRREVECLAEIESLRKALKQAEARREQENAAQNANGKEFIHLLSRLQEKGRFVDFLMEEIGSYSDQQVGTAARFVHDGCRAVVREYLDLAPVQSGDEGASITFPEPRSPAEIQFLGRSAAVFPVTGRLVHRGWRVVKSRLPHIIAQADTGVPSDIVAPAQVELN
jgi:hypothetical protein